MSLVFPLCRVDSPPLYTHRHRDFLHLQGIIRSQQALSVLPMRDPSHPMGQRVGYILLQQRAKEDFGMESVLLEVPSLVPIQ